MKTLLSTFLLISTICFGQYEEDTSGKFTTYQVLDYEKWTFIEVFPPTEEEDDYVGIDTLTRVMYNPIIEIEVIDSIQKYRESRGLPHLQIIHGEIYDKLIDSHYYLGMDISKQTKERILLERYDDGDPDCDCVTSISEAILDDSLTYGKRDIKLKDILLDPKIKTIEVNYYQVKRRQDPNKKEEHLIVKIKRRGSLISNEYIVILN